jgi:cell shape-determining protein MreD
MSDESDKARCTCARCRLGGLMGPAILITIGVLFLIQQFSNRITFGELWPVILIVIGAVKLLEATASTAGHVEKEKDA